MSAVRWLRVWSKCAISGERWMERGCSNAVHVILWIYRVIKTIILGGDIHCHHYYYYYITNRQKHSRGQWRRNSTLFGWWGRRRGLVTQYYARVCRQCVFSVTTTSFMAIKLTLTAAPEYLITKATLWGWFCQKQDNHANCADDPDYWN